MEPANWLRTRRDLAAAARSAIRDTNPRFRLKGSFARGDFHLRRDGSGTFSDIDLLLTDGHTEDHTDTARDRHAWEAEVADRMARHGWPIRVSVQYLDTVGSVGPADSQLLALAELVRFTGRRTEPFFEPYLLAKTCLTLCRGAAGGATPGLVRAAEQARRGFDTTFDADHAVRLTRDLPSTPVLHRYRELVTDRAADGVGAWTVERLARSTVHPWLRARLTDILREAVA